MGEANLKSMDYKKLAINTVGIAYLTAFGATLYDTYTMEKRGNDYCSALQQSFTDAAHSFSNMLDLVPSNAQPEQNVHHIKVRSTDIGGFIPLNTVTCTVHTPEFVK
jgi:hypothetical protein